jgi:DNA repair protein RadC
MPDRNRYDLTDTDLMLDAGERNYVLKIRDLATEDKPREKMANHGAAALTVSELLAVVLGVGTRKEGVLAMSQRLLKEYGDGALTRERDPKRVSEVLDIPLTKACQLVACLELGRRFYDRPTNGQPRHLRTPKQVFEYLTEMRRLPKEHLRGLYLDCHFRLIHDEVVSVGSVNGNLVHPREVFRPALERGAVAVILAHNHPSGVVKPSAADVAVTRQLVEAGRLIGINVLDHVIITASRYASVPADYAA